MPTNKLQTTSEKLAQLEELLAWFESDEVTVETAMAKYEEALSLAKELELQLKDAKNQVEVIKKKFSS